MSKYQVFQRERKINRILLIFLMCLVIILIVLYIYRIFFSKYYYNEIYNVELIPVLSKNYQQRELIKADDITYVEVPGNYITNDTVKDSDLLIGKYIRLGTSINAYSAISLKQIEDNSNISDYGVTLLNKNQTLFSLPTNLNATAGNSINSNMIVNLYLTITKEDQYISDLLIENVRIISIKDNNGENINSLNSDKIPYIINFAIDTDLIPLLNMAVRSGDIDFYVDDCSYDLKNEAKLNEKSQVLKYLQK